jgi:hypothetical protein
LKLVAKKMTVNGIDCKMFLYTLISHLKLFHTYARPLLKSNATFRYGMEYDEDYEFINNDPSKPAADHMKDENLSVKQLKMRYQGI